MPCKDVVFILLAFLAQACGQQDKASSFLVEGYLENRATARANIHTCWVAKFSYAQWKHQIQALWDHIRKAPPVP